MKCFIYISFETQKFALLKLQWDLPKFELEMRFINAPRKINSKKKNKQ